MSCRLGFYDQVKPAGLLCAERPVGPPPSTTASRNSDSSPDLTKSFDDRAGRVPTGFFASGRNRHRTVENHHDEDSTVFDH
jgi:hypothetical protein